MSNPLNGQGTSVTKIGYEAVLSYNFGIINDAGQFVVSGANAGTFSATSSFNLAPYSLPSSGENLVVRANVPINSLTDMVVTIAGLDGAGTPVACTGVATIKALSPRHQSFEVRAAIGGGAQLFSSITGVTITNGVVGDGFDISVLPHSANDVELLYREAITPNLGTPIKPIYNRYDLKHVKRLRPENKLTVSAFYTNNAQGLSLIDDRYVTLREDIHDDGGNAISEVRYFERCRLIVTVDVAAAGDASITGKAEGFFIRQFIFS